MTHGNLVVAWQDEIFPWLIIVGLLVLDSEDTVLISRVDGHLSDWHCGAISGQLNVDSGLLLGELLSGGEESVAALLRNLSHSTSLNVLLGNELAALHAVHLNASYLNREIFIYLTAPVVAKY